MNIYVASSWRNQFQQAVINDLLRNNYSVYDFRKDGFSWSEVDPDWQKWPNDVDKFAAGLNHRCAKRGFRRDMQALMECDVCVAVMPFGPSASMEMGWACGAGKFVLVYIPEIREPDLMVKMAHLITRNWDEILYTLEAIFAGMVDRNSHQVSTLPLSLPRERAA